MKRLERAQQRANELQARYQETRDRRVQRQEEVRKLENRAAEAQAGAERSALLPESAGGGTATATEAQTRVQEIEDEIQALEQEEEAARSAWEDAKAQVEEIARMEVPRLAEDLVTAREARIEALTALGRAVLGVANDVEQARAEEQRVGEDLDRVRSAAKPSSVQRRELDRYLKSPGTNAPPEAELGWLVIRVLQWYSRLDREDVREVLERHDLEPRGGSVIQRPIIAALDDIAHRLHRGSGLPY